MTQPSTDYYAHPSSYIDQPCTIGRNTKIWHFCHIMKNAVLGNDCVLGQNVFVADGVHIGHRVRIQNNVSVYNGVIIEDEVFCGPSCVFTNVINPRATITRGGIYDKTLIGFGATLGANCTVVCGHTVGRHAFIGAGAVVTADVPDYALMIGVPARRIGWMGRHGQRLIPTNIVPLLKSSLGYSNLRQIIIP
jgi:UDP-2-acetamido-3-amino-2,3-dideoxy-glucuronate N-acetyltransferase